nr:ankyrin repeat domain-containing protein [uncultured Shinella sp.]
MSAHPEYDDYVYIVDVLATGSDEQLDELEKLVDGFPEGAAKYLGRSWIRTAIASGSLNSIEWMLQHKIDLSFRDEEGYTVLHAALERAGQDKYSVLTLLLDKGAPVNAHGINDWTPAHMAAVQDEVEALKLLIEHGADLSIRTRIDDYETPLEEARSRGCMASVQLLENLADP